MTATWRRTVAVAALCLLVELGVLRSALADLAPQPALSTELAIVTEKGRFPFTVEVAITPDAQAKGLMGRRVLATDGGMLFDYGAPRVVRMWMKDTPISLDMLFIDEKGDVVFVAERTTPFSLTPIGPSQPVLAVLELVGGTAERLGVKTGSRVDHPRFRARGP